MHKQNAFSLVEMLIVVFILLIIMTISVIGVRGIQQSSRDNERKIDIETIAMNLETLYAKEVRDSSDVIVKPQGSYMPLASSSTSLSIMPELLDELERGAATAPDRTTTSIRTAPRSVCGSGSTASTCIINVANLNSELTYAKITKDAYVYVPYTDSTRICTVALAQSGDSCRSFKLYYVLEGSPTTVQLWESKRQ